MRKEIFFIVLIINFLLNFSLGFSQTELDTVEIRPSCAVEIEHLKRINYFVNAKQITQNDTINSLSLIISESKGWRFRLVTEIFYDGSYCYLLRSNYGLEDSFTSFADNNLISELILKLNDTYALDSTIKIKSKYPPCTYCPVGGSMDLMIRLNNGQEIRNSLIYNSYHEYCEYYPRLYDYIINLHKQTTMRSLDYDAAVMFYHIFHSQAAYQYLQKKNADLRENSIILLNSRTNILINKKNILK
jgi:hypothetical protein